jgi:hypothetical protein
VLPRAAEAYGVQVKLRGYSLNPEHDSGSHKARVFRAFLGITLDDADHLAEQLLTGVRETPISAVRDNPPHGILCEVLVAVRGVRGRADRTALTTTSWEYRSPGDAPRLVSAYIDP